MKNRFRLWALILATMTACSSNNVDQECRKRLVNSLDQKPKVISVIAGAGQIRLEYRYCDYDGDGRTVEEYHERYVIGVQRSMQEPIEYLVRSKSIKEHKAYKPKIMTKEQREELDREYQFLYKHYHKVPE